MTHKFPDIEADAVYSLTTENLHSRKAAVIRKRLLCMYSGGRQQEYAVSLK